MCVWCVDLGLLWLLLVLLTMWGEGFVVVRWLRFSPQA